MAEKQPKKPKKLFEDQFEDEEVFFLFRKHPVVMRKGLVISSLAMLAGPVYIVVLSFIYRNNPDKYPTMGLFFLSIIVSFVLAGLVFFPSWIAWYYSVYIVTSQRLIQITQRGLFHRSVVDIGLNQIQMVNYEIAGLQETLLGFGTIMMQTYMGDLVIHDVHHPAKIQKKLLKILREEGVLLTPFPGTKESQTNETQDS